MWSATGDWAVSPNGNCQQRISLFSWAPPGVGAPIGVTLFYNSADAANQRFIVSWIGIEDYAGTGLFTFQVIIEAGGAITYNYHTIPTNTSCTVGVENQNGTNGVQVCFDGEGGFIPEDGTAIRFWGGPSGESGRYTSPGMSSSSPPSRARS